MAEVPRSTEIGAVPADQALRESMPGVWDRGATQSAGIQGRSNAVTTYAEGCKDFRTVVAHFLVHFGRPAAMIGLPLLLFTSVEVWADSRFEGKIVRRVEIRADGRLTRISRADLFKLVTIREEEPYTSSRAHATLRRLYSTGIFHDVQIDVRESANDEVSVEVFLVRRFLMDQIRFAGQVEIDRRQLRRQLVLTPGAPYSDASLEETLVRLRKFYRKSGYHQAEVEPRFEIDHDGASVTLTFRITAGQPARTKQIEIEAPEDVDLARAQSWFESARGSVFSRSRLDEDLRRVKGDLARQGFAAASIREDLRYDRTDNTVSLRLQIQPGNRNVIEFEGMDLDQETLADLPIFSRKGLLENLLEATAAELRQIYQSRGYFLARVALERRDGVDAKAIVFRVTKGARCRIGSVLFEGNEFAEDGSLLRIVRVRKSGMFRRGRFTERMAQDDVRVIEAYYRRIGFRDVEVSYKLVAANPPGNDLTLIYEIQEGQRHFIRDVQFVGNEELSRTVLENQLQGRPGTPFGLAILTQDRANLLAAYEDLGYRQVECRFRISFPEVAAAHIVYFIDEGPRHFTDAVVLSGNLSTKEWVVQRGISIKSGDPASLTQILATERNLYDLAVFDRVEIREVPSFVDPLRRNLVVQVEEAKKYTLSYGGGYSSSEGPRGTLGISNRNFAGRAETLAIGLRAGSKRQRANLSYSVPRVFGRKLPTVTSLMANHEAALTTHTEGNTRALRGKPFDEFRVIFTTQTERPLSRRESMFFRYNFETVRIQLPEDLGVPLQFFREEDRLQLSSFALSYVNESRDDPTNATQGFFLTGDARLSLKAAGSDGNFFRALAQGQYYRKLFPDLTLASSLRLGWIGASGFATSDEASQSAPLSERFFSGGSTTLRGLPQELAGPLLRDPGTGEIVLVNVRGEPDPAGRPVPLGGNALLIANLELRFPLVAFLTGALFYDGGNVFRSFRDLPSNLTHAVGLGIQANTPFGPIRFDAGYNPGPPEVAGFGHWNFHFLLGPSF